MREKMQSRSLITNLQTRSDESDMVISGYFSVFDTETKLFPGAFEEVDRGAFDDTLKGDIRALYNHDANNVLGRTKSETLSLSVDDTGLFGTVKINQNDSDAVNLYHRIQRGDIDQASFRFRILDEDVEDREDGSVKWTLRKVDLAEISICPWGAYPTTSISARKQDYEQHKERKLLHKKQKLKEKIKLC